MSVQLRINHAGGLYDNMGEVYLSLSVRES